MITNIVFAGVRGGVGTTTVTAISAALLHQAGAVVSLADHSEGRLDSRLVPQPGPLGIPLRALQLGFAPQHQRTISVSLLDAGILHQPVARYLHSPNTGLVIIGSPDQESAAAIEAAIDLVRTEVSEVATARCRPCLVDVRYQRRPSLRWLERISNRGAQLKVPGALHLPFDLDLQPWGPVPVDALAARRSPMLPQVAELLDSVLTARVGSASPGSAAPSEEHEPESGTVWLAEVPAPGSPTR